jgi:chromosome segregation protein
MYLKSLELVGFKSFAEKTALEFLPGVTAIVGPNGCGKSNIVDAIRWVLGEQSAKALRGGEMADVIFSGTDGRRPIGMAEVSMTFADVDPQTLSLPGVELDFSEVTIMRRVFRDGHSEYFINKTPCRLRDIQSVFMDTGMGRSSYSILEQGKIDMILSSHPEDRRAIFEEAAGITKYKHQKKEALRKLDYTEQNLVRLTDIIREVKRQIGSLQRQAGKARRYKELLDQLKSLDSRLTRHKFDLLQGEINENLQHISKFQSRLAETSAKISEKETKITELRGSLADLENAITEFLQRENEIASQLERARHRIESNRERIAEMEEMKRKHQHDISAAEGKISAQQENLAHLNAQFDEIAAQFSAEERKLNAELETLKQLEREFSAANRELSDTKTAIVDIERQIAHARNEISAMEMSKKNDALRHERLSAEKIQLEEARQQVVARLETFENSFSSLRKSVEGMKKYLADHEPILATAKQEMDSLERQLADATRELVTKRARIEALQKHEMADEHATIGRMIHTDPPYLSAIEAALGANLHTILAEDFDAARQIFASHTRVASPEMPRHSEFLQIHGDFLWAKSVVRIKNPRFAPVIETILANVVIVPDLDAAIELRRRHPQLEVATQNGEFVSVAGIFSRISASEKAEMAEIAVQIGELESKIAALNAQKADFEHYSAHLSEEISRMRTQFHAKEVELATKEGERNAMQREQHDVETKLETVAWELRTLAEQDGESKSRREEILQSLAAHEQREKEMKERLAELQRKADELSQQRAKQNDVVTEIKIAVGGLQHKRDAVAAQREPIASRVQELQDLITSRRKDIEDFTAKVGQFTREIGESEQILAELDKKRDTSGGVLEQHKARRQEISAQIEAHEAELKQLRASLGKMQEEKGALEVKVAETRMAASNLRERLWQKYQVNLDDVRAAAINVTVADGGETITEQVEIATDWDAIEAQVAEMQSRLDAMGPVNIEAITEYDELEERHKFLTQQHEDLVKAKDQLLQVIAKINTTTKQLFTETFEKIRANFQEMFGELFGGGKANLLLLDESDPLESGIEIVAKPPGKQLQSISLLSGGERALCATALLFAIYKVKPSPFCVLDELDAPLDESNINRFVAILRRFTEQSQFVIVSHNKRTISMADALYGVTMEESGVSKIVSVKFTRRDETVTTAA